MTDDLVIPGDLVDMTQAARLAHCNLATLYRWTRPRRGKPARLRCWKRGGRYFVSEREVLGLFRPVAAVPPGPAAVTEAQDAAWVEAVLRRNGIRTGA